jgi:hypothetical protein
MWMRKRGFPFIVNDRSARGETISRRLAAFRSYDRRAVVVRQAQDTLGESALRPQADVPAV